VGALRSLQDALLEAYRLGYEDGDAHERPTLPAGVAEPSSGAPWDDELTPIR
jgi:hypothetical protein